MKTRLVIGAIVALSGAQPGVAAEIYKTTNPDGTVSYSNIAPDSVDSAEVIEAIPEPSAADQQAAQQRLQEIQANLEQRRIERAEAREEAATEAPDGGTDKQPPPINSDFIGVAPFL